MACPELPQHVTRTKTTGSHARAWLYEEFQREAEAGEHVWVQGLVGGVNGVGIVLAAIADMNKPAELISPNMTGVMIVYSGLFMRFAWMVRPRNYLLLACHATNECAQLIQMGRWLSSSKPVPTTEAAPAPAAAPAAAPALR